MIDLTNEVGSILKNINGLDEKNILTTWKKEVTEKGKTYVYFNFVDNTGSLYTEQGESTSLIQVTIHAYADKLATAKNIIREASVELDKLLYKRTSYREDSENSKEHVQASYIVEVDTQTLEHYRA